MTLEVPPLRRGRRFRALLLAAAAVAFLLPAPVRGGATPIGSGCDPLSGGEECTIAVISGRATADGRPIIWKNRDTPYLDNEVTFFKQQDYPHVALTNAGDSTKAWIGVNERGFAILNALSYNLPDMLGAGISNGELMKHALEICGTVAEFEAYLAATNLIGRPNPANIAVLDAEGTAAIFEAGNFSFVRFDATDSIAAPDGFLVRANFSLSADTSGSDTYRYNRCRALLRQGLAAQKITPAYLLQVVGRDLRSIDQDPYPLPSQTAPPGAPGAIGYVNTIDTINRRSTAAAGAVVGVLPGEDRRLSTFWAVLGPPIVTIPLPVWVSAGRTPPCMDGSVTSPLCDAAKERNAGLYDYGSNGSLLNTTQLAGPGPNWLGRAEEIEEWIFDSTERHLERWRSAGVDPVEMGVLERQIAADGYACYIGGAPARQAQPVLLATPNPMRESTVIRMPDLARASGPTFIEVFNVAGRRIARLASSGAPAAGRGEILWDGRDERGLPISSGVYFLRAPEIPGMPQARIVVIR